MYVFLKGGIQPCDECKKIGIAVVEVKSDADRELTGRRWLMKKEAIKKILADDSMLSVCSRRGSCSFQNNLECYLIHMYT